MLEVIGFMIFVGFELVVFLLGVVLTIISALIDATLKLLSVMLDVVINSSISLYYWSVRQDRAYLAAVAGAGVLVVIALCAYLFP